MKNVLKTIYALIKILPLVGELLEILSRRKETPDNSNHSQSSKDFDINNY